MSRLVASGHTFRSQNFIFLTSQILHYNIVLRLGHLASHAQHNLIYAIFGHDILRVPPILAQPQCRVPRYFTPKFTMSFVSGASFPQEQGWRHDGVWEAEGGGGERVGDAWWYVGFVAVVFGDGVGFG